MEKKVILIVEDDPVTLNMTTHFLNDEYRVMSCGTVRDAGKILQTCMVDALLLDFVLPDGTALDILDGMQALRLDRPAIVVSKFREIEKIRDCWQKGAFDFLEKPLDRHHLRETMKIAMAFPPPYTFHVMGLDPRGGMPSLRSNAVLRLDLLQRTLEDSERLASFLNKQTTHLKSLHMGLASLRDHQIDVSHAMPTLRELGMLARLIYGEELSGRCMNVLGAADRQESLQWSDIDEVLKASQRLALRLELLLMQERQSSPALPG